MVKSPGGGRPEIASFFTAVGETNKQTNKQSEGETYPGEFLGLLASLSLLGSLFVVGFKVLVRGMVIQPLIFEPLSIGV